MWLDLVYLCSSEIYSHWRMSAADWWGCVNVPCGKFSGNFAMEIILSSGMYAGLYLRPHIHTFWVSFSLSARVSTSSFKSAFRRRWDWLRICWKRRTVWASTWGSAEWRRTELGLLVTDIEGEVFNDTTLFNNRPRERWRSFRAFRLT